MTLDGYSAAAPVLPARKARKRVGVRYCLIASSEKKATRIAREYETQLIFDSGEIEVRFRCHWPVE